MKPRKPIQRQRLNLIVMILGMSALGAILMFLSLKVKPESLYARGDSTPATATAPSSGEEESVPSPARHPANSRAVAAQNLSGLLLLFSLVAFAVAGAFLAWLIVSIRRNRPAWQTQQRYPRRK